MGAATSSRRNARVIEEATPDDVETVEEASSDDAVSSTPTDSEDEPSNNIASFEETPVDNIVTSTPADSGPFRLLHLPADLVAHITSFLGEETLIAVRLVCKALEAITFERFAIENFENIYCWIVTNTDFQRLKNIIKHSPRLSSRIRQVTLTADVLRGRPVTTINIAREDYMDNYLAKRWAMRWEYVATKVYLKPIGVCRALRDIQSLPQHISIAADIAIDGHSELSGTYRHCPPEHAILFSLAMSHTKIHSLRIDQVAFQDSEDCDDLLVHNKADILATMSTLETLETVNQLPHEQIPIYEEIIRGAPKLHSLAFDTVLYNQTETKFLLWKLKSELLLANSISNLTSLRITSATTDANILIRVLQGCRKTLTRLVLRHVSLIENDEDWIPITQTMLAMPKVVFVELKLLRLIPWAVPRDYEGCKIPNERGCRESHIFDGREQVTEGLQSLLEHHPCLQT